MLRESQQPAQLCLCRLARAQCAAKTRHSQLAHCTGPQGRTANAVSRPACSPPRYPLNEAEKRTLKRYYALRWWERDGGFAGDVTGAEVQAIRDKYDPKGADLRAFKAAKAAGQLDAYWAGRRDALRRIVGGDEVPGTAAAAGRA